ncbi:MAG: DMT family transporter [Phaeodactylibacter sp.]|nr:DMT family transporter [Phaeodactylibacter sp.]
MDAVKRAYLELHIAVLLFGFTAILGDLIQLSALVIVWWRVLLTSVSLLFLVNVVKLFREMPRRLIWKFLGIGVLVAVHWLCFYGAIKYSNASITLVCMATTTFFTAFLEPLFTRKQVQNYQIMLGLLIIPGMVLIVNSLDFSMMLGVWVGLASAFLAALFATFNKILIEQSPPMQITFLELSSAWVFLSLFLPFYLLNNENAVFWPNWKDWGYLVVLALGCTTLAYVLALRALKHLSAFASNLTVNLEPVYGILLAWVLLQENEELSPNFYWGVLIILLSVFSYPVLKKRFEKQPKVT